MQSKKLLLLGSASLLGALASPLPQSADAVTATCTTYMVAIGSEPSDVATNYAATVTQTSTVDCGGCRLVTTTIAPYWVTTTALPSLSIVLPFTTTTTAYKCGVSAGGVSDPTPNSGYDPCLTTLCQDGATCVSRDGRAVCVTADGSSTGTTITIGTGSGGAIVPVTGKGTRCGANTCSKDQFCCNASCGVCAPKGGFCTQQLCDVRDLGDGGDS